MITLISVVCNRPEYTEVFLGSLYGVNHGEPIQPVIVDNGSRKRTQSVISAWVEKYDSLTAEDKERIARPRVITFAENKGFAAGINAGLKDVATPFVCVLHNDTHPFPGWAKELKEVLSADADAAISMPKTNYANEVGVCLPDVRAAFEKIKPGNKERIFPAQISDVLKVLYPDGGQAFVSKMDAQEPRYSYSVDVASFCMMFRTSLLEKYGLFDEEFFPRGYEDKFWHLKMQRDGWLAVIANRAFVHHFGNITSDGPGFSYPEMSKVNEERFKKKVAAFDEQYFSRREIPGKGQMTFFDVSLVDNPLHECQRIKKPEPE